VAQGVWSSVLVATGSYRALFTRVVYTEWIFFALMALSLLWLRRRRDYAPAYRAWGFPVTPLVFAAASAVIVVTQLVSEPRDGAIGLALVLVGLPVYVLWARGGRLVGDEYSSTDDTDGTDRNSDQVLA
jgi:APA family basic amino acid/polyamine antiporter